MILETLMQTHCHYFRGKGVLHKHDRESVDMSFTYIVKEITM